MTDVDSHSEVGAAYSGRSRRNYHPPLRTGGGAWGPMRLRVGMSMRELERRSGVNRWILSLAEQGRLTPTGEEFEAVMTALLAGETPPAEATQPAPQDAAGAAIVREAREA